MQFVKTRMFKSTHRISVPASVHANVLAAFATGCFALHVALTAAWAAMLGDVLSMTVGLGVSALVASRLLAAASSGDRMNGDLLIVAATLAWTTWIAFRHTPAMLWIPAVPVVMFLTPQAFLVVVLAASTCLAAWVAWVMGGTFEAVRAIGLALATGLGTLLYRLAHSRREMQAQKRSSRLMAVVEASAIGFIELDDQGRVSHVPDPLLERLGADGVMNAWRLLDLFHPDDHVAVSRAYRQAATAGAGEIAPHSWCDCRLLHADGKAAWVRVQFMKPALPANGTVATLVDIDGRIHLENALYENQRRLDAQTQELAAQFDASKKALHARQEVERLAQHDLKSPLKSIATAASMLRDGRSLSAAEEALLASIERTAGRALAIVSMSLDLYRMEEGTFRFVREIVDLGQIGRGVVADISLHARTKNVELSFSEGTGPHRAVGNEVFVTSVVENLVRNAVEAAPEHSTVRLCVRDDSAAGIGLEIHNQGSVPEAIRDNFFEKYVTHGKRDGLGLGTYSARLIARAQGGDLHMSSSDDNGTTLTLELTRDTGDLPPPPAAPASSDTPMPTSPPWSQTPQTTFSPVDLLVVEDDDHNWLLLSSWLPGHVDARRAINGRDAIDALVRRRPDLVIMDLEMPVMNGFEALQRIRKMQSDANEEASVVIAFTGYDDTETTRRIEAAGFDGTLSKPAARTAFDALLATFGKEQLPAHARTVWVEKRFAEAFPDFIASRRALVDDIEQAAAANDLASARRAAHTLAGSPAIHEFDAGIAICRQIVASSADVDRTWLAEQTRTLRAMLANPPVR